MSTMHDQLQQTVNEDPFSELFDFNKAADPIEQHGFTNSSKENNEYDISTASVRVSNHEQATECSTPALGVRDGQDHDTADYTNFSNYIPQYIKPARPCDHCASKQLDCFMTFGSVTCKPCESLFRSCSFGHASSSSSNSDNRAARTGFIDTLHTVSETACQEQGGLTGLKPLRSKGAHSISDARRSSKSSSSSSPELDGEKKATRFSRPQIKILRSWFENHTDHPYPTDEEKMQLEIETGLKQGQIMTWLANTRRRSKLGKGRPSTSSDVGEATGAVDMSGADIARPWSDLNPLERWQHSPPENDPAPINAIADAIADSDLRRSGTSSPSTLGYKGLGSSVESRSAKRAQSITSMGTGQDSNTLSTGSSAAWSHGSHSSFGSFNSFGSGLHGKRDRRKKRTMRASMTRQNSDEEKKKRIYQCTFCCDTFKSKYDWTRHEKTLHLSLEKWICGPHGAIVTDVSTGQQTCVYCGHADPDEDHIESHGHKQCLAKGIEARTFYRKDHLRQHLRLVHECELQPHMQSWKASIELINSRCGFCTQRFTTWADRCDHIAGHFKEGIKMKDWKGCRGLDRKIAANVTNSMPPYLIGMESLSPDPFTTSEPRPWFKCLPQGMIMAAKEAGLDRNVEAPEILTCWEVLTVALGHYVKQQSSLGTVVTDAMLQAQARRILYDSDDGWEQTAADNPEWLDLFKKAHGLDAIPSTIGGQGACVPEDLELYTDLGIRVPFDVMLKQGSLDDFDAGQNALSGARPLQQTAFITSDQSSTEQAESGNGQHQTGYSSLAIPAERALHFETTRDPSFMPGRLGPEIRSSDRQQQQQQQFDSLMSAIADPASQDPDLSFITWPASDMAMTKTEMEALMAATTSTTTTTANYDLKTMNSNINTTAINESHRQDSDAVLVSGSDMGLNPSLNMNWDLNTDASKNMGLNVDMDAGDRSTKDFDLDFDFGLGFEYDFESTEWTATTGQKSQMGRTGQVEQIGQTLGMDLD